MKLVIPSAPLVDPEGLLLKGNTLQKFTEKIGLRKYPNLNMTLRFCEEGSDSEVH